MPQSLTSSFFNQVRATVFGGELSQQQVNSLITIFTEATRRQMTDKAQIAFLMADTMRECGPGLDLTISEAGKGRGKAYGVPAGPFNQVYYGRGPSQLTWYDNYVKLDNHLKYNGALVRNPELACKPNVGIEIMFEGILYGLFTGHSLHTYIDEAHNILDFDNARRTVNGMDHHEEIAAHAVSIYAALKTSMPSLYYGSPAIASVIVPGLRPVPVPAAPAAPEAPVKHGLVAEIASWFKRG